MQNLKKISTLNLVVYSIVALFLTVISFSCTKEKGDTPALENAQAAAVNESANPQQRTGAIFTPFSKTVFVPCANGGAGENVVLSGTIHFVYQMTWTEHAFTLVYHDNLIGVTGVGATSGENFVVSGGTQGNVMAPWYSTQWVGSTVRKLRLTGANTKFDINYRLKLIVTQSGEVSVDVEEETIDCNVN